MFLELAEALDCPECRASFGLVAFVDQASGRRVVEGRLGCPLCEVEYPIREGTIEFGTSARDGDHGAEAPPVPETSDDVAVRIAALLGVTDRAGMIVLLGPGLSAHAPDVARSGDRTEVLAWLAADASRGPLSSEERSVGVDPIRGASVASWPIRTGGLDGVALRGPLLGRLPEAARCARHGGRLLLVSPAPEDADLLATSAFDVLAADSTTWLGERR